MNRNYILALIWIFLFVSPVKGDSFSVKESSEQIILSTNKAVFRISLKDEKACLYVGNYSIASRYQLQDRYYYINGRVIKEFKITKDEHGEKEVFVSFQAEPDISLELRLVVRKNSPCLFIYSSLRNVGDNVISLSEWEWYCDYNFSRYLASDMNEYPMPDYAGVDFTRGEISKTHWTTLGGSRKEKWLYLFGGDRKDGLGIVSILPTSFGMRKDRNVYWNDVSIVLEEGSKIDYDFVLIPAKNILGFMKYK